MMHQLQNTLSIDPELFLPELVKLTKPAYLRTKPVNICCFYPETIV